MALNSMAYEQGPIRPPSEAQSLLLRLTRNCPWNKCLFCPVYKGKKFSRRSLDEIKGDLEKMAEGAKLIENLSFKNGGGGTVNREILSLVHMHYPHLFQMAFWLYSGGERVFLQDGDSLLLPVADLVCILKLLQEKFPQVNRVTTYARSKTILRRTVAELTALREAGLSRIHVGLESGSDKVLDLMKKGVTGEQHIEAGLRVKKAEISLSEYILLGLGGEEYWQEHALSTASVINQINPDYIRMRTLTIRPGSPLAALVQQGSFLPLADDHIVREEALFFENLHDLESRVYSDHILNLLENVSGKLPHDKDAILTVINSYLDLPDQKRELFRLGRRTGQMRTISDLDDQDALKSMEELLRKIKARGLTVDSYLNELLMQYI